MAWTRRTFLKRGGLALLTLGAAGPLLLLDRHGRVEILSSGGASAAAIEGARSLAASSVGDRALVVIQLSGGNDGLNAVIPFGDGLYYQNRPQLAIPEQDVLTLTGSIGLHPSLAQLKALYDEGCVAIVQGVGYPNPNRSHFRSMDIWHTASFDEHAPYGWLGRYCDLALADGGHPLRAVNVGIATPRALLGQRVVVPSIQSIGSFQLATDPRPERRRAALAAYQAIYRADAADAGVLGSAISTGGYAIVRQAGTSTLDTAEALQTVAQGYRPGVEYPKTAFAQNLKAIAQILAGGAPTRVFYTALGGFDDHANEKLGHARLLTVFAEGVAAFQRDLDSHGLSDRVMMMAFSEFGRRVKENASGGTDHGAAGPVFLIGRGVRGGLLGDHPSLLRLVGGDLAYGIDFRSVYATVLDGWLGVPPREILGGDFERLGVFRSERRVS